MKWISSRISQVRKHLSQASMSAGVLAEGILATKSRYPAAIGFPRERNREKPSH